MRSIALGRLLCAGALCLTGTIGCKSSEPAAPEGQAQAHCACPDGKCQCPECQANDAQHCSCATKK